MANCPCGNEKVYEECCEIFHSGKKLAATCEELMRARYSAFVKEKIEYIGTTHVPGTKDFDPKEATEWSKNSTWKGLEILSTKQGGAEHTTGTVEFRALYSDKEDKDYLHHEISTFEKIDNAWFNRWFREFFGNGN